MSLGHNLQTLPPDSGGLCHPQRSYYIIIWLFLNKWLFLKFEYVKFLSDTFTVCMAEGGGCSPITFPIKLLSDAFTVWGGGCGCPPVTLTKKATWTSDFQSNEPIPEFLRHPFHKNFICPHGITYNPCTEGCWRAVVLKNIISRLFNYAEQNDYLKILISCVLGIYLRGRGGGLLPCNHFWLTKRTLAVPISNRMSLYLRGLSSSKTYFPDLPFTLKKKKMLFQNFDWIYFRKWWVEETGHLPSSHFWLLKRPLVLSISNPMSPLQSSYEPSFYKNFMCPQCITQNPSPEGWGEGHNFQAF